MPYANTTILPQGLENEPDDAPKQFTNIDTEDFECKWDGISHKVLAGETVTKPKYLVNFMAMHLARKMYKREVIKSKTKSERIAGVFPLRNEKEELKLQKEMVKANFPEEKKEETEELPARGRKTKK